MPRLTGAELQKLSEADRDLYQRKITEFEFLQGLGMQPDPQLEEDINQEFRMKTLQVPVDQQIRIMQRYASPAIPEPKRVDIPGLTPGGDPQTVPIQDVEGLRRGNVITQEELTRRLSALGPKSERSLERGGFVPLREYREAAQNDFIRQNQAELDRINALPSGSQQQLDALTAFEQAREDYVNQKLQEKIPDRADVAAAAAQQRVGGPRQASRFGTPRTRVAPSRIDFQRPGEDITAPGGVRPGPAASLLADSFITKVPIAIAETFIPGPRSTVQERAEGLSILGQSLLPQVIKTGEQNIEEKTRLKQIREVAAAETERQIEDRIGAKEYRAMSPEARTKMLQMEMGRYFDKYYEQTRAKINQDMASKRNQVQNYDDMVDALAARQTQSFIREIDPANTDEQTRFYNMYKDKYSFAASDIQEFTADAVETLFTNASDPAARDKLFRLGLIPDRNTITESTGGTLLRDVNLLFRIFENPIMDSLTTTVDKDGNIIDDDEFFSGLKPTRTVGEVEKGRALESPTVDVKGQGFAGYMKELGIETARARGLGNDVASLNFLPDSSLNAITYITTVGELFIPLPGMIAAKGLKFPKLTKSGLTLTKPFGGTRQVIKGTAKSKQLSKRIKQLEDIISAVPEASRTGARYEELVDGLAKAKKARNEERTKALLNTGFVGLQGYFAAPSTLVGAGAELITTGDRAYRGLRYLAKERANLEKVEDSLDLAKYAGTLDNVERAKWYDVVLDEAGVGTQLIGYQADKVFDIATDIGNDMRKAAKLNPDELAELQKKRDILKRMSENNETPALREMAKAAIRDPYVSKNRLVEIGLETGAMRSFNDYVLISPNLVMRKEAVKERLPIAVENTNKQADYTQVGFNQYVFKDPGQVEFYLQMSDMGSGPGYGIKGRNNYLKFIEQKMEKNIPLDIEEISYVRQYIFEQEIKKTPDFKQERFYTGDRVERPEADFTGSQASAIETQTYLRDKDFPVEPGSPVERRLRESERTTVFNTTTKPKTPTQVSKEIDRIGEANKELGKSGKKAIGDTKLPARATRAQDRIIDSSAQISRQMIPAIKAGNKRFGSQVGTVDAMIATDMKGENFLNILSTPERFADDIAKIPSLSPEEMQKYYYNLTMDMINNPTDKEARALVKSVVEQQIPQGSGPTDIMTRILNDIEKQNKGLLKEVASLDDVVLNRTYLNAKRASTRAIIREEILSQGEFFVDLSQLRKRTGLNQGNSVEFFNDIVSRKSADDYTQEGLRSYLYNQYMTTAPAGPLLPSSPVGVITPKGEEILKAIPAAERRRMSVGQKMDYLKSFSDDVASGRMFDYADEVISNQLRLNFNSLDEPIRRNYTGGLAEYREQYLRQNLQSSARKILDDQYIIADPQTKRFIEELMEDSFGDPLALKANLSKISRNQYATGAVMRSMGYQLGIADRARQSWISGQLGGQWAPNIAYQAENLITAPLIAYITRPNSGLLTRNPELRAIFGQMPFAAGAQMPQKRVFAAARDKPTAQYGNTRYTNQEIANAMNTQNLGNTAQAAELSRALQVDYQRALRSADGQNLVGGAKRFLTDIVPFQGKTTPWMRYAMTVDMSFREAVFLARVNQGDDLAKAARIAKDTMLDYGATPVKNFLNKQGVGKYFLYLSFLESTSRSILKALRQPNGLNRVLRMANYHNKMMNKLGQEKRGLIGDEALQSLWISTFNIYEPDEKISEPIEGYATYLRDPTMGSLYWFMNTADRTIGALTAPTPGMSLEEGFKALEEGVYSPYIQAGRQLATTGERRVPEIYLKRLRKGSVLGIPIASGAYGIVPVDVSDQELGRFASQPRESDADPMSGYQYKFQEGEYQKFAAMMIVMNIMGAERMINDYTYMWAESGALPKGTYFARDENGNGLWVLPEAVGRKRTRRLPRSWEAQDRSLRQQLREIQRIQKKQSKESLE